MTIASGRACRLAALLLVACSTPEAPPPNDAGTDSGHDAGAAIDSGRPLGDSATDAGPCASAAACDDGLFCNGPETCDPTNLGADANGCVLAAAGPCGTRVCDEAANACTGCATPDADGDGVASTACGGNDCDDANPARFPSNVEVCDPAHVDEDCDPTTFGYRDRDADGYADATCCNGTACGNDCDDLEPAAHPSEAESCDGIDNDCDTVVDEGARLTFYRDVDGDTFGLDSDTRTGCSAPLGYAINGHDCNDTLSAVHPGAMDICDMIDNDCDGVTDPPGCMCTIGQPAVDCGTTLTTGICHHGTQDCIDGVLGSCVGEVPPSSESCNTLDDDCDGNIDEGVTSIYYRDLDGDSYGNATMSLAACAAPPGYVPIAGDCNDSRAASAPGALETCNGMDDDCDGVADDGVQTVYFADGDGDGYGSDVTMSACSPPAGFVAAGGDCNDGMPAVHPLASEECNVVDDNCNGTIDEGCACTNGTSQPCGTPLPGGGLNTMGICTTGTQMCTSGNWQACVGNVPPQGEICNGLDDDCNGMTDDGTGAPRPYYQDCDRDGYGARGSSPTLSCGPPATPPTCTSGTGVWAQLSGDCADTVASINPSTTESCDGIDNNCDDTVDGALASDWCNVTPSMPVHTASGATCATSPAVCTYACATGYLDCDAPSGTYGCETDGANDRMNCGGCAHACLATATGACAGSRCVHDFVEVDAGNHLTCGRQLGGTVMCWGAGFGTTPTLVPGVSDATNIEVGDDQLCVLRASGAVFCTGAGYSSGGQTYTRTGGFNGLSVSPSYACAVSASQYDFYCWSHGASFPTRINPPNMVGTISHVAVSNSHACYRGIGSGIYCFALTFSGGAGGPYTLVPGVTAATMRAGSHTFCTTRYCWKDLGTMLTSISVTEVDVAPDDSAVCARTNSAGAISCGGDLYASPVAVAGTSPSASLAVGIDHRCLRRSDGNAWTGDDVYCWGANGSGQLGDGTMTSRAAPTRVITY